MLISLPPNLPGFHRTEKPFLLDTAQRDTLTLQLALRATRCPEAARGHEVLVATALQSEQISHRLLGYQSRRFGRQQSV